MSQKLRRIVIFSICILLFYALVGFVVIPLILEAKMPSILSERLGKPVIVNDVALNPFALTFSIHGFEIQEQDQTPLIGFQELFINFELSSIFRRSYTFDQIRLVLPYGVIKIRSDGKVNLADLAKASSSPAQEADTSAPDSSEEAGVPAVDIAYLTIEEGVVEFHDDTKPFQFREDIVPINISLKNFSTHSESENPYSVTAELTHEETLNWEGTFKLDPLKSEGTVSLQGMKLRAIWEYLQDLFRFEITDGLLSLSSDYKLETIGDHIDATLSSAEIHLKQFSLTQKGDPEPLMTIPACDVEGVSVDVSRKQVEIPSIRSQDARLTGWLNPDGTLNYQALFVPIAPKSEEAHTPTEVTPAPSESATQPEPNEKPWSVLVKELAIDNYAVAFEDRSFSSPAKLDLDSLNVQVHDVSTDFTKPVNFALSLAVNQSGTAEVTGTVQVDPLVVEVELAASHLALKPFQPYVNPFIQVHVDDGALELKGKTQFHGSPSDRPTLSYQGRVALSDLALANLDQSEQFLTWDSLALTEVALQVEPTTVTIGEIAVTNPFAKVVIGADGSMNLTQAFSPPQASGGSASDEQEEKPKKKQQEKSKSEKSKVVPVKINTVKIENASVEFSDLSLTPHVSMGVQDFTGAIKGLSSEQLTKADVDLKGKVDQYAPLEIKGQINPLSEDAYTDLAFLFNNWELTAVSPYSGKFAGYPITKGKLFLDMDYKVSEHTLKGENKILIDQLTMGEATNSPDAPSLPIPLALALLKDRSGKINIDLPVRGDLNDPEFSYGGIIWQAFINLITKVATSPFAALGGLLGASGEDFQFVAFSPGEMAMREKEAEKLLLLAHALEERPGLRLEVGGAADPRSDREALARKKLSAQLQQAKQQEMKASGPKGQFKPEEMELTKQDEARLLQKLYAEKFGKRAAGNQEGSTDGDTSRKAPLTAEEMKNTLLEGIQIRDTDLRNLAKERAKTIRDYLVQQGRIPEDRIFMTEVNLNPEIAEDAVRTPLTLSAG